MHYWLRINESVRVLNQEDYGSYGRYVLTTRALHLVPDRYRSLVDLISTPTGSRHSGPLEMRTSRPDAGRHGRPGSASWSFQAVDVAPRLERCPVPPQGRPGLPCHVVFPPLRERCATC